MENRTEDTLLTRESIYKLLAAAFYPPQDQIADKLWTTTISNWKPEESRDFQPNIQELRVEYNRLFVGPNAVPCPPYESVYRKDRRESERGMLMGPSVLDVKKRYNEAGLDISKTFSDLPDHIAVELEFMSFLCSKEENAESDAETELWRERQAEFWRLHLVPWVDGFSDSILKNTKSPFYVALTLFLKEWLAEEAENSFEKGS